MTTTHQSPASGVTAFDELAQIVRDTWPTDLSTDDRRALQAVYAATADTSVANPGLGHEAFLNRLPGAWVERDDNGQLVGLAGLSRIPTQHRMAISGHTLYGWCAWDCLFMAEILNRPIEVHSTCPATSAQVSASVSPDGVTSLMPSAAVLVFARVDAEDFAAGLRETFCAHVRLCADAEAGVSFAAADPRRVVISVDEAFALGTLRNRLVFGG